VFLSLLDLIFERGVSLLEVGKMRLHRHL
jgi:hypothetical protein